MGDPEQRAAPHHVSILQGIDCAAQKSPGAAGARQATPARGSGGRQRRAGAAPLGGWTEPHLPDELFKKAPVLHAHIEHAELEKYFRFGFTAVGWSAVGTWNGFRWRTRNGNDHV